MIDRLSRRVALPTLRAHARETGRSVSRLRQNARRFDRHRTAAVQSCSRSSLSAAAALSRPRQPRGGDWEPQYWCRRQAERRVAQLCNAQLLAVLCSYLHCSAGSFGPLAARRLPLSRPTKLVWSASSRFVCHVQLPSVDGPQHPQAQVRCAALSRQTHSGSQSCQARWSSVGTAARRGSSRHGRSSITNRHSTVTSTRPSNQRTNASLTTGTYWRHTLRCPAESLSSRARSLVPSTHLRLSHLNNLAILSIQSLCRR